MSAPTKPRGGSDSQLTKLKLLTPEQHEAIWAWRTELDAEGKPLTNASMRNRLAKQFSIRLSRDGQLSQFWSWYQAQTDLDESNDLIEQVEEFIKAQNPDWSPEKVRQSAITFFTARSMAKKDPEMFATIVTLDQRERHGQTKANLDERRVTVDEQKYLDSKKTEQQKALEYCLSESKGTPAEELFKQAFAALKKAKAK